MECLDSDPNPRIPIHAGRIRLGVKRSISQSYNRKCSLALGIVQLLPAVILFIYSHVTGFISMGYGQNTSFFILFISSFLLLVAFFRPVYSVVLSSMVISFISLPLPYLFLTPKGYYISYSQSSESNQILSSWIIAQFVFSLAAFCTCCQAFCCGTHGFTEIPRGTLNNLETNREGVNNWVIPRNNINMVNLRNDPTASQITATVYAPRANQANEEEAVFSRGVHGKENQTSLVVNLDNRHGIIQDPEGLPSYQQAMLRNVENV